MGKGKRKGGQQKPPALFARLLFPYGQRVYIDEHIAMIHGSTDPLTRALHTHSGLIHKHDNAFLLYSVQQASWYLSWLPP